VKRIGFYRSTRKFGAISQTTAQRFRSTSDYWAKPVFGRARMIPSLDSLIAKDDPVRIFQEAMAAAVDPTQYRNRR